MEIILIRHGDPDYANDTLTPGVLARFVDGILLVVEEERTTEEDLRKAMELLKDKPLIGTVMNKSLSGAN